MVKSKQKFLHKVAEEWDLKPVKIIYSGINSKQKPSYGGYNNLIYSKTQTPINIIFPNE